MTSLIEELVPHPPLNMRDISAWNGVPNIESLHADIIAIKATEGTGYTSPSFQADWRNAKAAHKARMAYHYLHPSISSHAQARFFLDTVKNAGLEDGDALCVDFEETDGLDAGSVAHQGQQFRDATERETKCKLVVYTYIDFVDQGNADGLENQPLWISDPSSRPGHPRVPLPFKTWMFHQFGVRRGIDEDICNFNNLEDFYKIAVLPTPPPLTPSQRMIKLTDGTTSRETLIELANFVTGFKLIAGNATFTVTDDGTAPVIPNVVL